MAVNSVISYTTNPAIATSATYSFSGTRSVSASAQNIIAVCSGSTVNIYSRDFGTDSGSNSPTATLQASATIVSIAIWSTGTLGYVFAQTATSVNFWRLTLSGLSGTAISPTATLTLEANLGAEIAFAFNGTNSMLFAYHTSALRIQAYPLDPDTVTTSTLTSTASLTVSAAIGGLRVIVSGTRYFLAFCEPSNNRAVFFNQLFSATGTLTSQATFTSANTPTLTDMVFDGTNIWLAPTQSGRVSTGLFRFNPLTISGVNPRTGNINASNVIDTVRLFQVGAVTFAVAANIGQLHVWRLTSATVEATIPVFVIYNYTQAVVFLRNQDANTAHLIALPATGSMSLLRTNFNERTINTIYTDSNSPITKASGGVLTLNQSISSPTLFSVLRSGVSQVPTGLGNLVYGFAFTATDDAVGTLSESFARTGSTVITDPNFSISMASGTVQTLGSAGTYDEPWDMLSGSILEITQNTILTSKFVLRPGVTVRSVGGAFALTIPYADPGVTLTGGATLIVPQIRVVATSFADGVRAQVSHRQIFTISSTAINTSTDILTLGADSNGDAANFRTSSPNTLVRFSLASGATIPTSTPQIIDGGLYYWRTGGQLSIVEGGTAINFSSQGSGNFVLVAETEINNAVVSGGSGYSFATTRSNNAQIRVKAAHWSELSGVASSSTFFDQVFAWSSTSGISILDTVNNAVAASQDAIHEQIVGITSLPLEGPIKDATGATITSITPANSGAAVTGLALALEGVGKIQMNATDVDGILAWQDLYLWGCYVRATEAGIRLASGSTFSASNIFNYVMSNLEFDNPSSTTLAVVGGVGTSADGSSLVSSTTTGSIILNALSQGTGAIVSVSGSGSFNPTTDPVIVGSIQANAITPNAIAANAITAAKIAPDALTEIRKDPRPTIDTN
jgi:hypothetical protein